MDKPWTVFCLLAALALHSAMAIDKPGSCPSPTGFGVCAELCLSDSSCEKDLKCCSNGCGHQCMEPVTDVSTAKTGTCPPSSGLIGSCVEACSSDRDCDKKQKCCSNGCGHQCMDPYKGKPKRQNKAKQGSCPKRTGPIGLCVEECSSDNDCKKDLKCCPNGCGSQCMKPTRARASKPKGKWIVKTGACPRRTWGAGLCAEFCSSDSDCENNLKCCSNGCGHECMEPYKVKQGRCPLPQPTQMCAEYCYHDGQCPGDQKCCRTSCGHACTEIQPC